VGGFLFAVGVSLSVDFTAGCAGALAGAMLAVASALVVVFLFHVWSWCVLILSC
jgi:hypothetical protein